MINQAKATRWCHSGLSPNPDLKGAAMSRNTKQTSSRIGRLASETLQSSSSSQVAKSLAASALSQRSGDKQTGAQMEDKAARVLASDRYAKETKELAASVLSQANRQR
jgi:type IV secretory pathway TrbL component